MWLSCSGALQVSTGSPAGDTGRKLHDAPRMPSIPINGTASDVVGIFSATRLRKTVNESSMVTPEMKISNFESVRVRCVKCVCRLQIVTTACLVMWTVFLVLKI